VRAGPTRATHLAGWRRVTSQVWFCLWWAAVALTGAAQLQADEISCKCTQPSVMSYLTPGRHGLVQQLLNIPSAATKATGTVRKRQAVRPAHHIQNHTCWVTLLQPARRAAVLGQPSRCPAIWSSQLDEVWCDSKQGSKETILPMQIDLSSFFFY
jgi:hypothetical protein